MEEVRNEAIIMERRKMAIKMINKGILSLEDIAAYCELTLAEVEELANKKSA